MKDTRLERFLENKKNADEYWDKIYNLFKKKKVGIDLLLDAMERCNNTEKAYLNVKRTDGN